MLSCSLFYSTRPLHLVVTAWFFYYSYMVLGSVQYRIAQFCNQYPVRTGYFLAFVMSHINMFILRNCSLSKIFPSLSLFRCIAITGFMPDRNRSCPYSFVCTTLEWLKASSTQWIMTSFSHSPSIMRTAWTNLLSEFYSNLHIYKVLRKRAKSIDMFH